MAECGSIKADGERCRGIAKAGSDRCPAHDPARKEARKRAASKAARSKGGSGELAELRRRLRKLGEEVLDGRHDPRRAAVAVQAWNAAVRTLEQEHRVNFDRRTAMSAAEVEALMGHLEGAIRKHVTDGRILDAVGRELQAVAERGD